MKIELSDNDIRELHGALRARIDELQKTAKKLREIDRNAEAENLDRTASDLSERLATHLAAALGRE